MEQVFHFLQAVHPLPDELREQLFSMIKTKTIPRREFLLKKGHISRHIFFIEKGVVRSFYMHGDRDITGWFMKEGDVVISINSFFAQRPSLESIQAMEDTTVHYISYEELESLYAQFVSFNVNGRKVVTHYYQISEQRAISMRAMKARDRYEWLLEHDPAILQRVPRKYIASYLGVTEATLSNIGSAHGSQRQAS